MTGWLDDLQRDGFTLLQGVFAADECAMFAAGLEQALSAAGQAGLIGEPQAEGGVYAARNVLTLWPEADVLWRREAVQQILAGVLGPEFGLVRALYFDKPPGRTWGLPWHRDVMIAVSAQPATVTSFGRVVEKGGVPHVKGSQDVLNRMITLRLHLDDVSDENGPMLVLPGSHHTDDGEAALNAQTEQPVFAKVGDILLFRPRLLHSSRRSVEGTERHRRILNLEFAAGNSLPHDLQWHAFRPVPPGPSSRAGRS